MNHKQPGDSEQPASGEGTPAPAPATPQQGPRFARPGVQREVEVLVRLDAGPGALERVLDSLLATHGIQILAYCAYREHSGSVVLLVTENAVRAVFALEAEGFRCETNSVLLVSPCERGNIIAIGASLADAGIQIIYSYTSARGDGLFSVVFKTADDEKAAGIIETTAGP